MKDDTEKLVFETTLDAPPEKVWRALSIPEYLDRWVRPPSGTEISVVAREENRCLTYRWREPAENRAVSEESLVTFEIAPRDDGTTWFRLTHEPVSMPVAANSNEPLAVMALAA